METIQGVAGRRGWPGGLVTRAGILCSQSHHVARSRGTTQVHFTQSQKLLSIEQPSTTHAGEGEHWGNEDKTRCGGMAWVGRRLGHPRGNPLFIHTTWRGQGARPSRPRSPVQTAALITHCTEITVSLLMVKQNRSTGEWEH